MAENETPKAPGTPDLAEGETAAGNQPSTAPLTVEAIRAALLPEFEQRLTNAYKAAQRAEAKADRAPERFRESIAPLEEAIEVLLTRDMTEDAKDAFKAKRELLRATRVDPELENQREITAFQQEASSVLEEEGIKADDPVLVAAYQKYVSGAKTSAQWRTALGRAVAAVHKDRAAKTEGGAAEREKKAREDERTKVLNDRRESEGPLDRGQPASSTAKIDWLSLLQNNPAEFARLEAADKAARRLRASGQVRR